MKDKGLYIAIGIVAFFLIIMGLINKRSSATLSVGSASAPEAGGVTPVIMAGSQYPNQQGIYQGLGAGTAQAQAQAAIAAADAQARAAQTASIASAAADVLTSLFGGGGDSGDN